MPILLPRRWTAGMLGTMLEHNQAIDDIEALEAENARLAEHCAGWERRHYDALARSARLAGALRAALGWCESILSDTPFEGVRLGYDATYVLVADIETGNAALADAPTDVVVLAREHFADFQFVVRSWCDQAEMPCAATEERVNRLRTGGLLTDAPPTPPTPPTEDDPPCA